MRPVGIGGHPAIDFVNTTFRPQDVVVELIGDGESFLGWMVEAGLLDTATAASIRRRYSSATLDAVAADARKLRAWVAGWIDRWTRQPRDAYTAELRRLNAVLAHGHAYSEVVHAADGVQIVQREHMAEPEALLAIVATQIALLFAHEDSRLVKHCAGVSCTLRFLDRTKAHRRVFCSATACGNRARVAAFRARSTS
jgi:predicted RNA-binding Zn ribbon-like protein